MRSAGCGWYKWFILLVMSLAAGCHKPHKAAAVRIGLKQDPAILLLVQELRREQPGPPYRLPGASTYNYVWAQYAMAFLALERTGYIPRTEAIERIRGIVGEAARFERYYGFFFDAYDPVSGKRSSNNIYFQGWWLYALYVLRAAYPELRDICEQLLREIDYARAGLFDPATRQLAADYNVETRRVSYWIDLFRWPSGEMRVPYIVYSLLTGDISPWVSKGRIPSFTPIEGHPVLSVWHNFHFCTMLVHTEFPELGYFERSWRELLAALKAYRIRNGMLFYPTRVEPLEAWTPNSEDEWPNDEHAVAKPWLTWFGDADAPVIEKAYTPGYGISLFYDNLRFYWSYGTELRPCEGRVSSPENSGSFGGSYRFPLRVFPLPPEVEPTTPLRLKALRFCASSSTEGPAASLEVTLNGQPIAFVPADEIGHRAAWITRHWDDLRLTSRVYTLEIKAGASSMSGASTILYRYESSYWKCFYVRRDQAAAETAYPVDAPYLEITLDGQREGGENAYAVLVRCAVVHGYYVWHELLKEPWCFDRWVAWVGEYHNRVRLARIVHNVSDVPTRVFYEDAKKYFGTLPTGVVDLTDGRSKEVPVVFGGDGSIEWMAEPWHTYQVIFPDLARK